MTKKCAEGPVKFAHLCEIDRRTTIGSEAWFANNRSGARRVDAIRALHLATGGHSQATGALKSSTKHSNIKNAHTKTIVRVAKENFL